MRPKRPRFRGKAKRRERLLDAMLQQLEAGIGRHARPQHVGAVVVGKDADAADLQRQRARLRARTGGTLQRRGELRLPCFLYVAQKLETQMNVLGTHPLHRELFASLAQGRKHVPELLAHGRRKVQGDERSNRLPRR